MRLRRRLTPRAPGGRPQDIKERGTIVADRRKRKRDAWDGTDSAASSQACRTDPPGGGWRQSVPARPPRRDGNGPGDDARCAPRATWSSSTRRTASQPIGRDIQPLALTETPDLAARLASNSPLCRCRPDPRRRGIRPAFEHFCDRPGTAIRRWITEIPPRQRRRAHRHGQAAWAP